MALTPQQRELALSLDAGAPPPSPEAVDALGAVLARARQENSAREGEPAA